MRFHISKITVNDVKELIANGDDSFDNQIRCSKDGQLFLSKGVVAADNIENLLFRFETFDSGNDYVGMDAANDSKWVERVYNAIIRWRDAEDKFTYIDCY